MSRIRRGTEAESYQPTFSRGPNYFDDIQARDAAVKRHKARKPEVHGPAERAAESISGNASFVEARAVTNHN